MTSTIRVAAAQCEIGTDVGVNLETCLRMIDLAAVHQPHLLVLPEFCNHLSWYQDRLHSYTVAVDLYGAFLQAVGNKAAQYGMYIMINCTVRRDPHFVTGTNILFDPQGVQIAHSDKQVLMGNENNFLERATECSPIIDTPLGRLGMYSCMDGVIYETPRGLALRGAQILLNSLNSFARDEGSLHIPVRAAENKVFVVAANKVGWLVPPEMAAVIAERIKIRPEQLQGAGESQIVGPDGTVLAKAPLTGEAVIYADIDPQQANNKCRPDGTDIFANRRPELYQSLAQAGSLLPQNGAESVRVTALQQKFLPLPALAQTDIVVLPELFGYGKNDFDSESHTESLILSLQAYAKAHLVLIATSIVEHVEGGLAHTGVLIGSEGLLLSQRQMHISQRHPWVTSLGESISVYDSPWGRIALIVGGDTIYPEAFRLAALQGVHIVLCSTQILESWEVQTGLIERAAENRLNVVVATLPTDAGHSLILAASPDFTLWTEWKNRPFDGYMSYPIVTRAAEGASVLTGVLYPIASQNRMVSQKTDLVDSRPYWLLDALTQINE